MTNTCYFRSIILALIGFFSVSLYASSQTSLKGAVIANDLPKEIQELYRSNHFKIKRNANKLRSSMSVIVYGCDRSDIDEEINVILVCDTPKPLLSIDDALLVPEPSPLDQIHLAQIILSPESRAAVLYSRHSQVQFDILSEHEQGNNKVKGYRNQGYFTFNQEVKRLIKNSDYILALPDETIFNQFTIRALLLNSYRANKPVFGPTKDFVHSGSLASLCTNERGIALSAINLARRFKNESFVAGVYFPEHLLVQTNSHVAKSFSINLPDTKTLLQGIASMRSEEILYE